MRIYADYREVEEGIPSAVTLGKFDGLHLGHRLLLERLREAGAQGLRTVVFTFAGPVSASPEAAPYQVLLTREERRMLLEDCGVDVLIEQDFAAVRDLEAEDFLARVLKEKLGAVRIICGEDFRFGKRRAGDAALLETLAGPMEYAADVCEKLRDEGEEISSTLLRRLVAEGEIERAARLLDGGYPVFGAVVHGSRLGHLLGTPTLNQVLPAEKLLPPDGVYLSRVLADGVWHRGITNIGTKPTVSGEGRRGAETHLLDPVGELYGQEIRVYLQAFLRPEQKFPDTEALAAQIRWDIRAAKAVWEKRD